jgi:Tol biopolymer transport system component
MPLFETASGMQNHPDISPDGATIVFAERGERGAFQLMWMGSQDRRAQRLHPGIAVTETGPRFSPDGTLLAYVSDVSGRREVYVEPFRSPGDRRIVSMGGGQLPRWSRDGQQLYFLSAAGDLNAVRVTKQPLSVSRPSRLFARSGRYAWADFDVTSDSRFFAHVPLKVAAEQPFTVLVNWPSLVKP